MASSGPWVEMWGVDPRPWLESSHEEPARWIALHGLAAHRVDDEALAAARRAAVTSATVRDLVARLPRWGDGPGAPGHQSADYLPNMLQLLADLGVRAGDLDPVDDAVAALEAHQFEDGRFASFGRAPGRSDPVWHALPCDTHSIAEVLLRYGRGDGPTVASALDRIATDLRGTNQGRAWTCIPDPEVRWRGPGRVGYVCPQVTLEALRLFSRVDAADRPEGLDQAAATMLEVWRRRGDHQPYSFGHGLRFKTVKWPPFWYGIYWMLDALGRYPQVWGSQRAADRRAVAELVACLISYNVSPDGTVTPRSAYRGFSGFSFGQKQAPSPIATALLAVVVRRFADLTDDVHAVEVERLGSSKGGTGAPRPPRKDPRGTDVPV